MQHRPTGWNQTWHCCNEDTASVRGAPTLPTVLPGPLKTFLRMYINVCISSENLDLLVALKEKSGDHQFGLILGEIGISTQNHSMSMASNINSRMNRQHEVS